MPYFALIQFVAGVSSHSHSQSTQLLGYERKRGHARAKHSYEFIILWMKRKQRLDYWLIHVTFDCGDSGAAGSASARAAAKNINLHFKKTATNKCFCIRNG